MAKDATRGGDASGGMHIDRLNVTKKTQSVNNFTGKLQNAYARLQKHHKEDEKLHMQEFADLEMSPGAAHRTRLTIRVQRDFRLGDLTD